MISREYAKMCVGEGWHPLVDKIYDYLSAGVLVSDVKEKFGGLRVYVYSATEEEMDFIDKVEDESYKICEFCGKPGEPSLNRGWIKTLCTSCEEEITNE